MREKRLKSFVMDVARLLLANVLLLVAIGALGAGMPALSAILVTSAGALWVKALRGVTHGW